MILINLLPHREAARKRRKEEFYVHLFLAAVAGALVVGAAYLWYQARIGHQEDRNLQLTQAIAKLDLEIKDIATLEAEIESLRARKQAVEDLQGDRNLPVYMMEELVTQLPDGVYLVKIEQTAQAVTIQGYAQSQERVSELLRNISTNSQWMGKNPQLIEIVASDVDVDGGAKRRVSKFTLKVDLVRPSSVNADSPEGTPQAAGGKG
ncbi:PilN domain-containing protein [Hydrogenophaga sp. 5NK40-0174]|uniref:PilN domain-containing protein n=1 Tax=Hydrogenophaga sp. 5NK40-0174 TaxID=3127649 RepID=UPI00310341FC